MKNEQHTDTMVGLLTDLQTRLHAVERRPQPPMSTTPPAAAIATEAEILNAPEGATYLALDTGRVLRRTLSGLDQLALDYDTWVNQPGP